MIMVTLRNNTRTAITIQLETKHTGTAPHLQGVEVSRRTLVEDPASGQLRPKDSIIVSPPSVTIPAGETSQELPLSVTKTQQVAALLRSRRITIARQTE